MCLALMLSLCPSLTTAHLCHTGPLHQQDHHLSTKYSRVVLQLVVDPPNWLAAESGVPHDQPHGPDFARFAQSRGQWKLPLLNMTSSYDLDIGENPHIGNYRASKTEAPPSILVLSDHSGSELSEGSSFEVCPTHILVHTTELYTPKWRWKESVNVQAKATDNQHTHTNGLVHWSGGRVPNQRLPLRLTRVGSEFINESAGLKLHTFQNPRGKRP
jgi:hypothetical protein